MATWDPDGFMFAQEWARYILKKTSGALPTGTLAKDEFDAMLDRNAARGGPQSELVPASYRDMLGDPFTTHMELAEQRYYWRPVHTNGDTEDAYRFNFPSRQRSIDPAGGLAPTLMYPVMTTSVAGPIADGPSVVMGTVLNPAVQSANAAANSSSSSSVRDTASATRAARRAWSPAQGTPG